MKVVLNPLLVQIDELIKAAWERNESISHIELTQAETQQFFREWSTHLWLGPSELDPVHKYMYLGVEIQPHSSVKRDV